MANMHTVKQGEYMAYIASQNGFTNWQTIWDLPQNADLKNRRTNPNILFPGDQVYIPDLCVQTVDRPTDGTHSFKLKRQKLTLRLTLQDIYEEPIANAKCLLSVDGTTFNLTSNGNGTIEQDVPPTAQKGILVIQDPDQTAFGDIQIPLLIGSLDPVEEVSGQIARLNNLGYSAGDPDSPPQSGSDSGGSDGSNGSDDCGCGGTGGGSGNTPERLFRAAVEEFQCDQNLTVDGICGPQTQAALKKAHGC